MNKTMDSEMICIDDSSDEKELPQCSDSCGIDDVLVITSDEEDKTQNASDLVSKNSSPEKIQSTIRISRVEQITEETYDSFLTLPYTEDLNTVTTVKFQKFVQNIKNSSGEISEKQFPLLRSDRSLSATFKSNKVTKKSISSILQTNTVNERVSTITDKTTVLSNSPVRDSTPSGSKKSKQMTRKNVQSKILKQTNIRKLKNTFKRNKGQESQQVSDAETNTNLSFSCQPVFSQEPTAVPSLFNVKTSVTANVNSLQPLQPMVHSAVILKTPVVGSVTGNQNTVQTPLSVPQNAFVSLGSSALNANKVILPSVPNSLFANSTVFQPLPNPLLAGSLVPVIMNNAHSTEMIVQSSMHMSNTNIQPQTINNVMIMPKVSSLASTDAIRNLDVDPSNNCTQNPLSKPSSVSNTPPCSFEGTNISYSYLPNTSYKPPAQNNLNSQMAVQPLIQLLCAVQRDSATQVNSKNAARPKNRLILPAKSISGPSLQLTFEPSLTDSRQQYKVSPRSILLSENSKDSILAFSQQGASNCKSIPPWHKSVVKATDACHQRGPILIAPAINNDISSSSLGNTNKIKTVTLDKNQMDLPLPSKSHSIQCQNTSSSRSFSPQKSQTSSLQLAVEPSSTDSSQHYELTPTSALLSAKSKGSTLASSLQEASGCKSVPPWRKTVTTVTDSCLQGELISLTPLKNYNISSSDVVNTNISKAVSCDKNQRSDAHSNLPSSSSVSHSTQCQNTTSSSSSSPQKSRNSNSIRKTSTLVVPIPKSVMKSANKINNNIKEQSATLSEKITDTSHLKDHEICSKTCIDVSKPSEHLHHTTLHLNSKPHLNLDSPRLPSTTTGTEVNQLQENSTKKLTVLNGIGGNDILVEKYGDSNVILIDDSSDEEESTDLLFQPNLISGKNIVLDSPLSPDLLEDKISSSFEASRTDNKERESITNAQTSNSSNSSDNFYELKKRECDMSLNEDEAPRSRVFVDNDFSCKKSIENDCFTKTEVITLSDDEEICIVNCRSINDNEKKFFKFEVDEMDTDDSVEEKPILKDTFNMEPSDSFIDKSPANLSDSDSETDNYMVQNFLECDESRNLNETDKYKCERGQIQEDEVDCKVAAKDLKGNLNINIPQVFTDSTQTSGNKNESSANDEKPFICLQCGFSVATERNLEVHVQAFHSKKKTTCRSKPAIKKKRRISEKEIEKKVHSPTDISSTTKSMTCPHFPTNRSSNLRTRLQSSEDMQKCNECSFLFNRPADVTGNEELKFTEHHSRVPIQHPVLFQLKCNGCDFKPNSEWLLRNHRCKREDQKNFPEALTIHASYNAECKFVNKDEDGSGINMPLKRCSFPCLICNFRCSSESSLIQHYEEVHQEFRLQCNLCTFQTTSKLDLTEHKQKEHSSKHPFVCHVCQFITSTQCCLQKHLKIHDITVSKIGNLSTINLFSCKHCNFKTDTDNSLAKHCHEAHKRIASLSPTIPVKSECNSRVTNAKPKPDKSLDTSSRKFQCRFCKFICKKRNLLDEHKYKMHTDKLPYSCDICSFRTDEIAKLRSHEKGFHKYVRKYYLYTCKLCPFKTSKFSSLARHKNQVHCIKHRFKCSYCTFRTNRKLDFSKHVYRVHPKILDEDARRYSKNIFSPRILINADTETETKLHFYYCSLCSYKSKSMSHYEEHLILVHDKCLKCPSCPAFLNSINQLFIHKYEFHKAVYKFKCSFCCFCSVNKKIVEYHENKYHHLIGCYYCEFSVRSINVMNCHILKCHPDKNPLYCDLCGFQTMSHLFLQSHHWQMHPKLDCSHCEFLTYSKKQLMAHMCNSHSEQLPFSCTSCPFKAEDGVLMTKHKNSSHNNHCDLCTYVADSSFELGRHKFEIHPEAYPLFCLICSYRAAKCVTLICHELNIHYKRTYRCTLCIFYSDTIDSLSEHFSKCHFNTEVNNSKKN